MKTGKIFSLVILLLCHLSISADWTQKRPLQHAVSFCASGTVLYAAADGYGLCKSPDTGTTWTSISGNYVGCVAAAGNNIWAACFESEGTWHTTDGGTTWQTLNPYPAIYGAADSAYEAKIFHIWGAKALLAFGSNALAGNYQGVFKSCSSGWSMTLPGTRGSGINCFTFCGSTLLCGSCIDSGKQGAILISKDSGVTFTVYGKQFPGHFPVTALTTLGRRVFACGRQTGYIMPTAPAGAVYSSTDTGATWTRVFTTTKTINCLAVSGSMVFAGTGNGVYLSADSGATWTAASAGLPINFPAGVPGQNVSILSVIPFGGKIFAALDGFGLWSRPLSEF